MRRRPSPRSVAVVLSLLVLAGGVQAAPAIAARPTLVPLIALNPVQNPDSKCPDAYRCVPYQVSCNWNGTARKTKLWVAENENNPGYVGGSREATPPRGVAVFFSGGSGKTYWYPEQNTSNQTYVEAMMDAGIYVVDLRFNGVWKTAPSGDTTAGLDDLACRGASVVKHVYETMYVPKVLDAGNAPVAPLVCGFCISGYSAGTALAVYTGSHYWSAPVSGGSTLGAELDGIVVSSGPIYTALNRSCNNPVTPGFGLAPAHLADVDLSYGILSGTGPCASEANKSGTSWPTKWKNDSIAWSNGCGNPCYSTLLTSGVAPNANYNHPNTRLHVILGAIDNDQVWTHSRVWQLMVEQTMTTAVCDFHQQQPAQQQPGDHCREQLISGMGHSIKESPLGMQALVDAITWTPPL